MKPRIGSLFTGYGGLDLAVASSLDGTVAWHADNDPAAQTLLAHHRPNVPNHGDITAVDWSSVEPVDILTGGFPCQDVSTAGRRAGLRPDTRSGLWGHMAHVIATLRPTYVIAENVRGLLSAPAHSDLEPCPWCLGNRRDHPLRALGAVLGDLASLGYDARWTGLRAADVGAPHDRYRVFIAATDTHAGGRAAGQQHHDSRQSHPGRGPVADTASDGRHQGWSEHAGLVGRPDAALGSAPPAHADGVGHQRAGCTRDGWSGFADDGAAAADAGGPGLEVGSIEPARDERQAAQRGRGEHLDWGEYEPAIRRWEHLLGRRAPEPTVPGQRGNRVLSPLFVEWLMGLPSGHVTAVPGMSRNAQLRLLGNGVVPQQAATALTRLLDLTPTVEHSAAA